MSRDLVVVGWREWVGLPRWDVPVIKAKVDTGARTSSLHASEERRYLANGREMISFVVHPYQANVVRGVRVVAPLHDEREVRSSNGLLERRAIVVTEITLGDRTWAVELTLTSREEMGFRMLLGRQALRGWAAVNPARSYMAGKPGQPATGRRQRS